MNLREAAQQALEVLESVLCDPEGKCCIDGSDADRAVVDKELAALRAALAQEPAQYNDEPSGYESITPSYTRWVSPARYAKFADNVKRWYRPYWVPKEKQQAEPAQKSSEFRVMVCGVDCHPGGRNCNGYCTGKTDDPPEATAEQQAEPVQGPFALPCPTPKACREHCCSGHCIPRATSPQQAEPTRSQRLADAGFTRRPNLWALQARKALELIATPQRPDGTWNRDREACRQLATEALGRYEDE